MNASNRQLLKLPILLMLLAVLVTSFGSALPMAHADSGGTQVRVESVTLSPDETTLIITVSATIKDNTITNILFDLTVSYGDHHLNIKHPGTVFDVTNSTGSVVELYATTTFQVPYQGPGYYLVVSNAYNCADGTLLGSVWVDPREGTTP
jgi:hypothetical protein